MLRSDLCDFSDAYIVVKGDIIVTKKTFTADYIEAPNNTAVVVALKHLSNSWRHLNIPLIKKFN